MTEYNKLDVCKGVIISAPVNDVSFMQVVKTLEDLFHNAFHLPTIAKQCGINLRNATNSYSDH